MKQALTARFGQSSTEYSLALALVTLVGIGGLAVFGPDLLGSLSVMGSNVSGQAGVSLSGSPTPTGTPVSLPPGSTTSVVITLSDGSTLPLPNFPADQAALVLTAGANGTTDLYIAALRDMTDQLVLSGELEPSQAAFLTELANQGHALAAEEKYIENQCLKTIYIGATSGFVPACNGLEPGDPAPAELTTDMRQMFQEASGAYWQGSYNPRPAGSDALSFLLERHSSGLGTILAQHPDPNATILEKFDAVYGSTPALLSTATYNGAINTVNQYGDPMSIPYTKPASQALLVYEKYRQSLDSGALNNPAVKTVVDHLVNEILTMNVRLGKALDQFTNDVASTGWNESWLTMETYTQAKASAPTNSRSVDICTTGGGGDSGVQCTEP